MWNVKSGYIHTKKNNCRVIKHTNILVLKHYHRQRCSRISFQNHFLWNIWCLWYTNYAQYFQNSWNSTLKWKNWGNVCYQRHKNFFFRTWTTDLYGQNIMVATVNTQLIQMGTEDVRQKVFRIYSHNVNTRINSILSTMSMQHYFFHEFYSRKYESRRHNKWIQF